MKKKKNLIENKVLINTFKKFKLKNNLNKSNLKKKSFFFLKYKIIKLNNFFKKLQKINFLKNLNKKKINSHPQNNLLFKKQNKNIFKTFLMFIIYIFSKIHKSKTPTQRFKKSNYLIKFNTVKKYFRFFLKNNSGRNNNGRITVFSKGLKKKAYSTIFFKTNLWDSRLTTVSSIIRNKKKLITLNKHISGSISLKPHISGVFLGQKTFSSNLPKKFWFNKLPGNLVLLKFLTKFSIFSNIYVNGYNKYALANGTFCQVLDLFSDFNLVKLILPSKKIKLISGWNFVILGKNSLNDYKYNRLGKAGVNYLFGKKPKVRGVARNPVDHPHGGRTKTNQPEVSVWGWIAKRNK